MEVMESSFLWFSLILGTAVAAGIAAKMLHQPAFLGYIAAGVAAAQLGWLEKEAIRGLVGLMGQLGVTFLLFLVGLEMSFGELKRMGRVALATGLGQIAFTSVAGYFIARGLGLPSGGALYLAVALTFSSTILIVKLLSEKAELASLHGKIAVGFLLVQDFVAVGILIMLSGVGQGGTGWPGLGWMVIKGIILVALVIWLSGRILPSVFNWLGRSSEVLFMAAIAWCLALSALVASPWLGFSVEIGGFLAGLALANAPEHLQIVSRVRPLRDFFLTLFFVALGTSVTVGGLQGLWWPALVLSIFVLLGKPLIMMVILSLLGYRKRTSFLVSVSGAQISEFSLIVVALAGKVGQVSAELLALVVLVGLITMTVSSYLILHAGWLYRRVAGLLGIFERKGVNKEKLEGERREGQVVLLGHNRIGGEIRSALTKSGLALTVVDFNPDVVEELVKQGVKAVYGDAADYDLYEEVGLGAAAAVVSTVPDVEDNLQILEYLKEQKRRPVTIMTALSKEETARLYRAGADYVLMPYSVGGEYLAHLLAHHGLRRKYFQSKGRNRFRT